MDLTQQIKRCQSGDSDAFAALLDHCYDRIFSTAFRWCGDRDNAQDITQNVCLKLSKAILQFRFEASFTSWLYQITINAAKDFYKSPRQHNTREQYDVALEDQQNSSPSQEKALYTRQLLSGVGHLPDDLQDALILVFVNGLSHREAAEQLQLKESTISWRVHEARKQLREHFTDSISTQKKAPQPVGGSS